MHTKAGFYDKLNPQILVKLNFEKHFLRPNFIVDFEFFIENKIARLIDEKFEIQNFPKFKI